MNQYQLNAEYDCQLKEVHWALIGVPDFDNYHYKGWVALSELQYLKMGYWMAHQEVECEDCPNFDDAVIEADYWGDWLNDFCDPYYSGPGGDREFEQARYELDQAQTYLNKYYPLV